MYVCVSERGGGKREKESEGERENEKDCEREKRKGRMLPRHHCVSKNRYEVKRTLR